MHSITARSNSSSPIPLIDLTLFQFQIRGRILLSNKSYSTKNKLAKSYLSKSGRRLRTPFNTRLGASPERMPTNCLFSECDISNQPNLFNLLDFAITILPSNTPCPCIHSRLLLQHTARNIPQIFISIDTVSPTHPCASDTFYLDSLIRQTTHCASKHIST